MYLGYVAFAGNQVSNQEKARAEFITDSTRRSADSVRKNDKKEIIDSIQQALLKYNLKYEPKSGMIALASKGKSIYTIGNINKLRSVFFDIQEVGFPSKLMLHKIQYTKPYLTEYASKLTTQANLLKGEMDNPYLNSSDTLRQLWVIHYNITSDMVRQISFELDEGEVEAESLSRYLNKAFDEYWLSYGALTGYGFNRIDKDLIRLGQINKKGKAKLNPKDFYK